MNSEQLLSKITAFWKWFQENRLLFQELIDPEEAKEALDNQILEFGLFSWEINEGSSRPYSLTISPNGDQNRLAISQQIVQAAPSLPEWEFHYCKPPKDWDFTIELYNRFMVLQRFDVSEWEYVLPNQPGENIEVVICAKNLRELEIDDRLDAGELVLSLILGEEMVINHLSALEVLENFDPEYKPYRKNISLLKHDFEASVNHLLNQ